MKLFNKIVAFEWDSGNKQHIAKHNVKSEEAEEVFYDDNCVNFKDLKHSGIEERYIIIGSTKKKKILYQVFTIRRDKIRIISSRNLNRKEVSLYEKKVSSS